MVPVLDNAGYVRARDVTNDLLVGIDSSSPELRKRFFRENPGQRRANIHVRESGRVNQVYPLLFRDYLRDEGTVRAAYEQIKRELASRFPDDSGAYYAIKDPFMDTIYRAAQLWKDAHGWEPDSDFR